MKIAKWGNSLAVRVPAKVAREMDLTEGEEVELRRSAEPNVLELSRSKSVDELISGLRKFRGGMPKGFKFDRDEANER